MIETLLLTTFLLVPSAQRPQNGILVAPDVTTESIAPNRCAGYGSNYEPQEWKEIGQEETESKLAKQNSGAKRLAAKSYVSENEPANNTEQNATRFDIKNDCCIYGTLHVNSGWVQFWNHLPERDEDFYRFTLDEKLLVTFCYNGPAKYNIELYAFGDPATGSATRSLNCFYTDIELDPGTYYCHIYANNKSDIVGDEYALAFSTRRITYHKNVKLDESVKTSYQAAVWNNEKWFRNATERPATANTVLRTRTIRNSDVISDIGFIDPLFSDETSQGLPDRKEEWLLSSVLYLWGDEALRAIRIAAFDLLEAFGKLMQANPRWETIVLEAVVAVAGITVFFRGFQAGSPSTWETLLNLSINLPGWYSAIKDIFTSFSLSKSRMAAVIDILSEIYHLAENAEKNKNLVLRIPVYTNFYTKTEFTGASTFRIDYHLENSFFINRLNGGVDSFSFSDSVLPANVNYTSHLSSSVQTGQLTLCASLDDLGEAFNSTILR